MRATIFAAVLLALPVSAAAAAVPGTDVLYTQDAHFDGGGAVNVNHDAPGTDQLQVNRQTSTFPFIWIALSARGTIAKIDTRSGEILGEFSTTPDVYPVGENPSRTTVGLDGSVWAGNRAGASVVHVGLDEANGCVDRNANGTIETSSGYGDVLPWANATNDDTDGGVTTAQDECIIHFVRTTATAVRHVTVTATNDVWVTGKFGSNDGVFDLIDGDTGAIIRSEGPFPCGGYGGLVDGAGVVWSASSSGSLLRWDPNEPLDGANPTCVNLPNYGLALDRTGNIWVSTFGQGVRRVSPDGGTIAGPFNQGANSTQGLAVDANNHLWLSSSLSGGTTVGHLLADGTFIGNVTGVGNGSTGVAVDAAGKIWTANINSSDATRIDPTKGPLGSDGVTPIGEVDLTVPLPGAGPYNYSDMTGNVLLSSTAPQGRWAVVQDSGQAGTRWGTARWNREAQGSVPPGSSLVVEVRAAETEAGLGGADFLEVADGAPFDVRGRLIEARVTLVPAADGTSPVLSDLRICAVGPCGPVARPVVDPPPPTAPAPAPAAGVPSGDPFVGSGLGDPFVVPPGCDVLLGFTSTRGRPASGGRLDLNFLRKVSRPVDVDVFQTSLGRRVVRERLVARFTGLTRSLRWDGVANRRGRRVVDGSYFARFTMRLANGPDDVRRVTLLREDGQWQELPPHYRRSSCGLVRSFKLLRPVFGGSRSASQGVAFILDHRARVGLEVLRGSEVVRRFPAVSRSGGRTHRLTVASRGLPLGELRFRLTAIDGDSTLVEHLTSRVL